MVRARSSVVEHATFNRRVVGSNPTARTLTKWLYKQIHDCRDVSIFASKPCLTTILTTTHTIVLFYKERYNYDSFLTHP